MNTRRTDLALEAHALFRAAQRDDAIDGLTLTERTRRGCAVTTVTVEGEAASDRKSTRLNSSHPK